jgi:hypothetical protein
MHPDKGHDCLPGSGKAVVWLMHMPEEGKVNFFHAVASSFRVDDIVGRLAWRGSDFSDFFPILPSLVLILLVASLTFSMVRKLKHILSILPRIP